jgi:hypothetical protein
LMVSPKWVCPQLMVSPKISLNDRY